MRDIVEERFGLFDKPQKNAVNSILDQWNSNEGNFVFPIVDGPPGTGKTAIGTIAAAKYLQENKRGQVAYLCYTHFAVDKAKKDLHSYGLPPDKVVELHYNPKLRNWKEGIYGCDPQMRLVSFNDQRRLKQCGVLLCTLHASRRVFKLRTRPKVVVDEFSQVSVPMFFSVLHKIFAERCNPEGYALLGDPIQLPVISTQPLLRPNIGIYVMQRKPHNPHKLLVQHRMHKDICEAVNSLRDVYRTHRIESSKGTRERNLSNLGYSWKKSKIETELLEILDPSNPLVIVNTDKYGKEERVFGGSVINVGEAKLAARLARNLYISFTKNGKPLEPWILSPYTAQVEEIKQNLPDELERNCITIYKSQGRENPCVIISFVRNNPAGRIGFLGEGSEFHMKEQTYVGCSRAKGKLILLLSFDTFIGHGNTEFEALLKTKEAHIVDR